MRKILLIGLVGLGAIAGYFAYAQRQEIVELPRVDTSLLEDDVREEIDARHEAATSDPTDTHLLDYAIALHAHDLMEAAIDVYDLAASRAPKSFLPRYLPGVLIATTDPERAIPYFEGAAVAREAEPLPHLRLGLALETLGRSEDAEAAFRRSLERGAQAATLLGLARIALERGRPDEAMEHVEAAMATSPREAGAWSLRARVLTASGRRVEAADAARIAGALPQSGRGNIHDPHVRLVTSRGVSSSSLKWQANLASADGRLPEALSLMARVIALRPDDADTHFERGVMNLQMGRFQAAIADARQAQTLREDWAEPFVLEGTATGNAGNRGGARKIFEAGVERFPDSAGLHSGLATALLKDDTPRALHHCERALELDPVNRQAALQRARILAATSKEVEARRQLAQILKLYPRETEALVLLTKLYVQGKNRAQALKTVQRILAINPEHAEGRRMLKALGG